MMVIKTINFLENHTRIFDEKLYEIGENFCIKNVRNSDSVYIYGILDSNKEEFHFNYLKTINFLENHTRIFDEKLYEIGEIFVLKM